MALVGYTVALDQAAVKHRPALSHAVLEAMQVVDIQPLKQASEPCLYMI